jgi:hypothetical protein
MKGRSKSKTTSKPKSAFKNSKKVQTISKRILKYPKKIKGLYFCNFCPKKFTFTNNLYAHQKECIIGINLNWLPWQTVVSYSKKIAGAREAFKKADEQSLVNTNNLKNTRPKILYKNRIPKKIREEFEMM